MKSDFHDLLKRAVAGCQQSIQELLQMYAPLIDGHSYLRGKFDEDLRQYVIVHIVKNLNKFKIDL